MENKKPGAKSSSGIVSLEKCAPGHESTSGHGSKKQILKNRYSPAVTSHRIALMPE
jgi:hypothetical protein